MNERQVEGLKYLQANRKFLATEFLTYLYYGVMKTGSLKFDNHLVFIGDKLIVGGTNMTSTHKGEHFGNQANIWMSLKKGLKVNGISLTVQHGEDSWDFFLDTNLCRKQLKLPPVNAASAQEHIVGRFKHIQYINDFIDKLYSHYMSIRLSPAFSDFTEEFTQWVNEGLKDAES